MDYTLYLKKRKGILGDRKMTHPEAMDLTAGLMELLNPELQHEDRGAGKAFSGVTSSVLKDRNGKKTVCHLRIRDECFDASGSVTPADKGFNPADVLNYVCSHGYYVETPTISQKEVERIANLYQSSQTRKADDEIRQIILEDTEQGTDANKGAGEQK